MGPRPTVESNTGTSIHQKGSGDPAFIPTAGTFARRRSMTPSGPYIDSSSGQVSGLFLFKLERC